jgi:hypothetical protein
VQQGQSLGVGATREKDFQHDRSGELGIRFAVLDIHRAVQSTQLSGRVGNTRSRRTPRSEMSREFCNGVGMMTAVSMWSS